MQRWNGFYDAAAMVPFFHFFRTDYRGENGTALRNTQKRPEHCAVLLRRMERGGRK